jgi:hypothetical protein
METCEYYLSNNIINQLQNYGLYDENINLKHSIDDEIESVVLHKDFHLGNKDKILALEKVLKNIIKQIK